MIRNRSGQTVGSEVIDATTGAAFAGTVTVYVTGDHGIQAIGQTGSGAATLEGQGYYTYTPSRAETNYSHVAFTFIGSGAVAATTQGYTTGGELGGTQLSTTFNATDVMTDALLDIGVIQPGETIGAADAQFALRALNQIVSGMQNAPLTFPFRRREVFDVVAEQATYSIGPGGDFDTERPQALTGAGLLMPSQSDTTGPVEIPRGLLTDNDYQAIQVKDMQTAMWTGVYFNATYADGLASVTLWPVPNSTTYQLVLYWGDMLTGFANLTQDYDFPPGVSQVFRYQLGEVLASSYGKEWTALLDRLKNRTLAEFKRQNFKLADTAVDMTMARGGARGGYIIQVGNG